MSTAPNPSQAQGLPAEPKNENCSRLEKFISEGRLARDEEQRENARDLIAEFVDQVMAGTMTVSKDTQAMINARIGQIDRLISGQLNEVLHHPEFQKLESSWRGLHYF